MPRRLALLIGIKTFDQSNEFAALRTPDKDVQDVSRVLRELGEFEIYGELIDSKADTIRKEVEKFYGLARRGDLTLLYYSGHGYRDREGKLFFIAKDTQIGQLLSTAVGEDFIHTAMSSSRSRHRVIILDCCYSGAFIDEKKGGNELPLVGQKLSGEATAILASSGAIQYSYVGDLPNSIFTYSLLKGILTGEADLDLDGYISASELFEFTEEEVKKRRPEQTPMIEFRARDSDIIIAVTTKLNDQKRLLVSESIESKEHSQDVVKEDRSKNQGLLKIGSPIWLWVLGLGLLVSLLLWALPSPTGTVVFAGENEVYLVAGRNNLLNISNELENLSLYGEDSFINISSNGEWIVLLTTRFDPKCGTSECLAVGNRGGGWELVRSQGKIIQGINSPVITPDGSTIIFESGGGPNAIDIWAITKNPQDWGPPMIISGASPYSYNNYPALSLDNQIIAFSCSNDLDNVGSSICLVYRNGDNFSLLLEPTDLIAHPPGSYSLLYPFWVSSSTLYFRTSWTVGTWSVDTQSTNPYPSKVSELNISCETLSGIFIVPEPANKGTWLNLFDNNGTRLSRLWLNQNVGPENIKCGD